MYENWTHEQLLMEESFLRQSRTEAILALAEFYDEKIKLNREARLSLSVSQ